jgi:hypothetical protein
MERRDWKGVKYNGNEKQAGNDNSNSPSVMDEDWILSWITQRIAVLEEEEGV